MEKQFIHIPTLEDKIQMAAQLAIADSSDFDMLVAGAQQTVGPPTGFIKQVAQIRQEAGLPHSRNLIQEG